MQLQNAGSLVVPGQDLILQILNDVGVEYNSFDSHDVYSC